MAKQDKTSKVSQGQARTVQLCPNCEQVFQPGEAERIYECGECGETFTADESPSFDNRCPGCNRFASKMTDTGCPECKEELVEEEQVYHSRTRTWSRVGESPERERGRKLTPLERDREKYRRWEDRQRLREQRQREAQAREANASNLAQLLKYFDANPHLTVDQRKEVAAETKYVDPAEAQRVAEQWRPTEAGSRTKRRRKIP